ncbi:L,D-transpeptidase family protein [Croceicoccus marinus]|uniref:L,D-transpeptidase n=1 Tax=Croceicoccus marinus TaxID=450378 RepID=A0A1Z1FAF0_9SPHN|nr:L,D-transpeptidase family protein [Croceicoccus marinus]ARU15779.1 L,D-transpeptidase [Croceicoccus marinus]
MGRAKFMFPNHLGIYLHDTPARDVFARSARYVSNGCVRLERADDLANFLSSSDLVFGDAEQPTRRVVLAQPVPVFIMHFTFWAEGKTLSFHNDVYHKDQPLLDAVQIEGMPGIS